MIFYQFQKRFPNDDACLHQIMISRYGGTKLPARSVKSSLK